MTVCYDPSEHTAQYDIQNLPRGKRIKQNQIILIFNLEIVSETECHLYLIISSSKIKWNEILC